MGKKRQSTQPRVFFLCSFNLELEHNIRGSSFLIVESSGGKKEKERHLGL